jgi:hypothetical protein
MPFTPEEAAAGFSRLAHAYGFYGTRVAMEKELGIGTEELMNWPVYEFHLRLQYMANQAAAHKKYIQSFTTNTGT